MEDGTKSNTKENIEKYAPKPKKKDVIDPESKPQRKPIKKIERPPKETRVKEPQEIEETEHRPDIESESDIEPVYVILESQSDL